MNYISLNLYAYVSAFVLICGYLIKIRSRLKNFDNC